MGTSRGSFLSIVSCLVQSLSPPFFGRVKQSCVSQSAEAPRSVREAYRLKRAMEALPAQALCDSPCPKFQKDS